MKKHLSKIFGFSSLLALFLISSISLLLASCGGGSSSNENSPAVTYSVSGQVTSGGSGLSGVTVTLSGAGSATATSDASGNYTFSGLANGNYSVTPSKTGLTFSPTSSSQTVNGANISAVNFTATAIAGFFSISGSVTSGGSGLSGVTITLSGAGSGTATTDASGNYTFSGLVNGSYTVTPSKTGFTFSPASSPQTVSGVNISSVNFGATSVQKAQIVACPSSGTTDVTIQDFSFTQSAVTVSVNGIVKWTNNGRSEHTVTSGVPPVSDGTFNSGILGLASTVCVQFLAVGSYPYYCVIHPFMTGSVTVQ